MIIQLYTCMRKNTSPAKINYLHKINARQDKSGVKIKMQNNITCFCYKTQVLLKINYLQQINARQDSSGVNMTIFTN